VYGRIYYIIERGKTKMSKAAMIQKLEKKQLKQNITLFRVGDTVRVHTRIIEGEKERIQIFTGTVIARKGSGLSETFSVHRVAYGEGMERVFPLHSPRIAKIEVVKEGDVRRGKLYYLRGTSGKASKVKGRIGRRGKPSEEQAEGQEAGIEEQPQEEKEEIASATTQTEETNSQQ
jgi:large subunit ribosomal protein L19